MLNHKLIPLCLLFLIFTCCDKEDVFTPYTYQNESTIYSDGTSIQFREILLTIKLYVQTGNGKKYLVTDSLLNVTIKMNEVVWGKFNSLSLDTSVIVNETFDKYLVSGIPLKYNVLARYQPAKPLLSTAGEYSNMLRSFLILEPGFYFCQVESFGIRLPTGEVKRVVPLISQTIEVSPETRSLYLGEYEVEIN